MIRPVRSRDSRRHAALCLDRPRARSKLEPNGDSSDYTIDSGSMRQCGMIQRLVVSLIDGALPRLDVIRHSDELSAHRPTTSFNIMEEDRAAQVLDLCIPHPGRLSLDPHALYLTPIELRRLLILRRGICVRWRSLLSPCKLVPMLLR